MANVTGGPTEPDWLNKGDNAWQLTAATFVGLQSLPGLVVLYAGKNFCHCPCKSRHSHAI
jgi:ammonium transporter, Amt family